MANKSYKSVCSQSWLIIANKGYKSVCSQSWLIMANKGYKTSNIPLVNKNSIPKILKENPKITCVIGLSTEPERLVDIRKNRMNSLKETENKSYTDFEKIKKEVEDAKSTFKKYKWPMIDVTRKSVEETAASVIKIYEIYKQNV